MFRIQVNGFKKKDLIKELVDEFIPQDQYVVEDEFTEAPLDEDIIVSVNKDGKDDLDTIKRDIYRELEKCVKHAPDWGILTGVRPVKLAGELTSASGKKEAREILRDKYLLSPGKTDLILGIYEHQQKCFGKPDESSVSLYIGIPFCPTRCSYCAFASNQKDYSEIKRYLDALNIELDFVSKEMKKKGLSVESLYIGGGTPTVLTSEDLDSLMQRVSKRFDLSSVKEYTVEAGRPDTIDKEKLITIKNNGANRISINPQSMLEKTLAEIGRLHSPDDIERAYWEAKEIGFDSINMDMIAGLPGESVNDFIYSLRRIQKMKPENITVHSLAVKRASRLKEEDPEIYMRKSHEVRKMVKLAFDNLLARDYRPYYLYRQKHMAGACENIGYSLEDKEGLYNVRIMDEHQTNIALGAGGISKVYYPQENRLERVANVTNYTEYINRIDEMLERKKEGIFNEHDCAKGN